jgi:hypothetical protein
VFSLTGIQKHVVGVAGWVAILTYIQKKRNEYLEEKDAVLRHYIELHPEEFPIPGILICIIHIYWISSSLLIPVKLQYHKIDEGAFCE